MKKIYNKLVRDKMVDIYEQDVKDEKIEVYAIRTLSPEEICYTLRDKLLEEVQETIAVYEYEDKTKLKEEIADVIEVIDAILYHNNIELKEVLALRDQKKENRGGFEKGVFLESIDYFDEKL